MMLHVCYVVVMAVTSSIRVYFRDPHIYTLLTLQSS